MKKPKTTSVNSETIASFWHGRTLNQTSELCLRSWARFNDRNHLYTAGAISNLPRGITLKNLFDVPGVAEYFDKEMVEKNPSGFSNLFRALLLSANSDVVWLDTDVVMLEKSAGSYGSLTFGFESPTNINGAILSLPDDSNALADLLRTLKNYSGKQILFGDMGPKLLTKILKQHKLIDFAFEISEFYEIRPEEVWKLYSRNMSAEIASRLSGKKYLHLWNETSKLAPVNLLTHGPQIGSFLYGLDPDFWILRNLVEIENQHLETWSQKLAMINKRNQWSSKLPNPVARAILISMGRRIPSGY